MQKRNTPQKKCVLNNLIHRHDHPTAEQVYDCVKLELPKVSLGTIYRNLDDLTATGKIRKIAIPGGKARYDGNISPHNHAQCLLCGTIVDLPVVNLGDLIQRSERFSNFSISNVDLLFKGYCPTCKNN